MTAADPDIARSVMAALNGDRAALDAARMRVAEGYGVNGLHDGTTLLERAVDADNLEVARFLLDAGAEFRTTTRTFRPPSSETVHCFQSSAASSCQSKEMAAILGRYDPPFAQFEEELFPHATGAALIPDPQVTPKDFRAAMLPRFGASNPEPCDAPFLLDQIRTGRSASGARRVFLNNSGCPGADESPVWSFQRFGRTTTRLPDGRLVLIAGEHEDHYDPNFCIYNDVVVLDGQGGVQVFLYPQDIFPPTDFHSATLIGDHIWLIGSLGYTDRRDTNQTQVLRLSLNDFSMARIATTGETPGWIHRHDAERVGDDILVSGGKVEPGYRDLEGIFALDLPTRVWRRVS